METRSPAYIAVLAVIAGSILMVGSLMRPSAADPEPVVLPTQAETARLQRMAQRNSIESMARYFAETASSVAGHLVYLGDIDQTAIVWDADGTLITSNTNTSLPNQVEVLGARGTVYELQAPPVPPESPARSLHSETALKVAEAVHIPATWLEYGEWLVLTWLSGPGEKAFAPALYLGSRVITCGGLPAHEVSLSVTPSREMAGSGLFDLDGRLIGVVALCDGKYATLLPESIDAILEWNQSFVGRLLGEYGLRVTDLTKEEQEYFDRDEGVIVREVWRGFPAAAVGLVPGDIVISFDDRPVTKPEDLQPLVLPAARHLLEVVVRRGRRNVKVVLPAQVSAGASQGDSQTLGLIVADDMRGFPVQSVLDGSPAARQGLRAGDRLLTVDGTQVSSVAQAQRSLSSENDKGRFVVVARGRKQWGVLLN